MSLTDNPSFKSKIAQISVQLSKDTLSIDNLIPASETETVNPGKLFTQGTALSFSESEQDRESALKIAHYLLLSKNSYKTRLLGQTLLKRLGNRTSALLAEQKGIVEVNNQESPGTFSLLRQKNVDLAAIHTVNGEELYLNRFQSDLISALSTYSQVAVSAPTSAGKSFIVERWISESFLKDSNTDIALIVPTRALIHQMEVDMRKLFSGEEYRHIEIITVPNKEFITEDKSNLFIFTQERFHSFLSQENNSNRISSIVVDEAQKISDGSRGILLQQVIEEAARRNPNSKIIFLTPATKNPEILFTPSNRKSTVVTSGEVTVGQNLYWISQLPRKPKEWEIFLSRDANQYKVGTFEIPNSPKSNIERLSYLAHHIGGDDIGNIVYVNGAADSEKCAMQLSKLMEPKEFTASEKLIELAKFCAQVIHPKYSLTETLKNGVAFHYGNMPLIIRSEIEDLFSRGEIRFLVCTSTLIEGVNTACRNLFVRGPQRGQGNKMDSIDFWNLAGRAGRWGKEFEGNIFCIDTNKPDIWLHGTPPQEKTKFKIERAIDKALISEKSIKSGIISNQPKDWGSRSPEIESSINYLYDRFINYNFNFDPSFDVTPQWINDIGSLIGSSLSEIRIDPKIIKSNPGINPRFMQSLLEYFSDSEKSPEEFLPSDPNSSDAATQLALVFIRTHSYLGSGLGPHKRSFALAILVNNWMRGYPLRRIIERQIKYARKKAPRKNLASIIRSSLNDIENIARFLAPKYLSCYNAVLEQHLNEIDRKDLTSELNDYSLYLEFGASTITHISAMSLGLSRSSSIALAEYLIGDNLSKDQIIEELRKLDIESLDLPRLIQAELLSIIS